ncbi:MAG TPA: HD domain-containing protein [Polyangiaceae bacterium]|nr:HD domain-containing protein [Polyangiaceae bacterium]
MSNESLPRIKLTLDASTDPEAGSSAGPPSAREASSGEASGPSAHALTRLEQQLAFIQELDQLKQVQRKSFVSGTRRLENSAEHSWHVALMAVVLAEHAAEPGLDVARVVRMLLVHDVVEIDAGDTLLYAEEQAQQAQRERERAAAERLFGLLPEAQGHALRTLWEEFEARESPEAKFARAIDRLEPLLLNFMSEGAAWRRYGVVVEDVLEKNRLMAEGSPALWRAAEHLVQTAVLRGYLKRQV